jgi:hypothetical protein
MSAYHAVEWLIVAAAVGGSAWMLAKRLIPRLRSKNAAAGSGGCSSCDSCGSCSTPQPRAPREQNVHWHSGR